MAMAVTKEEQDKMKALKAEGKTIAEISALMNRADATVYRVITGITRKAGTYYNPSTDKIKRISKIRIEEPKIIQRAQKPMIALVGTQEEVSLALKEMFS